MCYAYLQIFFDTDGMLETDCTWDYEHRELNIYLLDFCSIGL